MFYRLCLSREVCSSAPVRCGRVAHIDFCHTNSAPAFRRGFSFERGFEPFLLRRDNITRASLSTEKNGMGARFFGLDAIEWSVTFASSALIMFAAWMM